VSQPVLEFRDVSKNFGAYAAVDRVGFEIDAGEIFTLLGPSGSGKTTTLRLVAGLEEPDGGEILVKGQPVAAPGRGIYVAPDKRQMGMVFQSYAIWPHLTVYENVAFPLRVRRESRTSIKERVGRTLEIVGLAGFEERGATELSGGQQQRVALARALVYEPSILLLDEPLSNLDAKLREQMRFEIRALQKKLNLTVLYVTHDQAEAMTLSDRIGVMNCGHLEQLGSPADVYEKPATSFVADFLGRTITLEGTVVRNHAGCWFDLCAAAGRIALDENRCQEFSGGESVRVLTRPEDIQIVSQGELSQNEVPAAIAEIAYLGDHYEYNLRVGEMSLMLPATKRERFSVGSRVWLRFDPERLNIHRL
jgi:iron(III) transport system ATP-binding protein